MQHTLRQATAFVASILIAGCSQGPTSPSAATRAAGTAVSVGDTGVVGGSAAGDTKVGSGALDLVRLRMDRQDSSGNSILRQYAQPGGTYNIRKGETIELWAEYEGVANPRLIVDFGDGFVDFINCGSCLIKHKYEREGRFVVTAKLDDRVSTTVTRTFTLQTTNEATGTFTFCNSGSITIPNSGEGVPFPSTINVSGLGGSITQVKATVRNLSHTFAGDVNVFLLSPGNRGLILLNSGGGGRNFIDATLHFEDGGDPFPTPGPSFSGDLTVAAVAGTNGAFSGPFGDNFAAFLGSGPNGAWRLFVYDDTAGDSGAIAGGWCVAITTN